MIAIVTASRGLIYSKTVQSIIEGMQALNTVGIATKYYSTHDMPIPDCFNCLVEKALQDPKTAKIFFIEEDMYIDPEAFVALATGEGDVVTVQYNDKNGSPFGIVHYNEKREIMWAGMGATVIKREVFEKLGSPYLRTDVRYKVVKKSTPNGPIVTDFEEIETRSTWQYGGQDVDLYTRVRKLGFSIVCLPNYKAAHFQLVQLGESHVNNGLHVIRQV